MAEQQHDEAQDRGQATAGTAMKRRGILRAAGMALGAIAAGVAAKQSSQPVSAASVDTQYTASGSNLEAFRAVGSSNTSGAFITGTIPSYQYLYGVNVTGSGVGVQGKAGDNGTGVRGEGTTASGVIGVATTGYGVQGINNSANTPAIYGTNSNISGVAIHGENSTNTGYGVVGGRVNVSGNPFNGAGVYGKADGGHALHGEAGSGWGLYATSTGPNPTAFAQNSGGGDAVSGKAGSGHGVYGESASGDAIVGKGASGRGVYATSTGADAIFGNLLASANSGYAGVHGSGNGAGTYGVYGSGSGGTGVAGVYNTTGAGGIGVQGLVASTNAAGTIAVQGVNQSTGAGGVGVAGTSTNGSGVVGGSQMAAAGVAGGYFYTTANSGSGVVGQCFNPGGGAAAFVGAAVAPNYAAYFTGDVVVTGNFIVGKINGVGTGGGKSAAVEDKAGGGHRLVYCVESPESWFEDFGEGALVNGKAEVKVDPAFMALIHTDSYHVFLTPHDEEHHLAVKTRGGAGFAVAASVSAEAAARGKKASDAAGTFSWRVVGKRSDTTLERFAPYAMPAIKLADKPPVFPAVATPVDEPLPKPGPAPQPQPQPRPAAATAPTAPVVPAAQGGQGAPTTSVPAPLPPSR